ncbi:C3a anaphylatoxin chemotactic receptor-like [Acipenser oxyrinchus oxyrinchus]|uniref:C3a anaphylatoxin chemotactic receptor-like n=1 Tax=Acipenser oxyrinchus oxyrinchus TaxID=40147 RepID=A0AAD8FX96_ACIOX|nr:C3a anaphylatoxin chemotactic receptor-like [Acipenser oxyrinchus oxyrinchus]
MKYRVQTLLDDKILGSFFKHHFKVWKVLILDIHVCLYSFFLVELIFVTSQRMELSNITMSTKPLPQKTDDSVDIDYVMEMVLIVLYSITIILGVTGNSIVIWMTGFKLKKTVTNVWLLNLAVADLVFCFTRVTSLLKNLFYTYWPFGEFLCKFNGFFKYMNMFCSVFLLSVISLDRCFSVVFPIRIKQWRTVQMASFASVGVWALATAFSLPYFLFRQVSMDPGNGNLSKCSFDVPGSKDGYQNKLALYILRFLIGFLVPFLIIVTCYAIMACKLRQTRVPKKSFKIIAALVAAFFFCWAPYHVFLLAKMVNKKSLAVKIALPLFKGLAYFNSCINPILYFLTALDLKKRYNQTLSLVCIRAFSEESDSSSHCQSTRRDRCTMANTVQVAAL